jgi:hypothetical protein
MKKSASGMIGNGLEWYEYALYGQMVWLGDKKENRHETH